MKQIIIIDDDIHLARLMQDNINVHDFVRCDYIFTNPLDFLSNPIEADIYLLDIVMAGKNGLEVIQPILKLYPNAAIVMNTIKDDAETIFKALQAGALGYIDKQSFQMNFSEVFESIADDGAYMTPKIARQVVRYFGKKGSAKEQLTEREKDIVNGILDGLSYKLIADKYNIAIDTVRMNVKKVYRKLNINSKSELFKIMGNN
jgi:DNA-binding NarL/FixJ family response regulator